VFSRKRKAKVIALACARCDGTGEVGRAVGLRAVREATKRCAKCHGVGRLYPSEMAKLVMNWIRCFDCRGDGYVDNLTAAHNSEATCYFDNSHETVSPVQRVLRAMRLENQTNEVMALELAYGEVGARIEKKHSGPITLALWPITGPGKELILELRCKAKTLHGELLAVWNEGTVRQQTLASRANTAAIAGLENALCSLFAADKRLGFEIRTMAERLDGGLAR